MIIHINCLRNDYAYKVHDGCKTRRYIRNTLAMLVLIM